MTSIKVHSLRSRTVVLIFPFETSTQRGARLLGSPPPVVQQPELHLHRPLLFTIFHQRTSIPDPLFENLDETTHRCDDLHG